jgi:hypothetical protein
MYDANGDSEGIESDRVLRQKGSTQSRMLSALGNINTGN